MESPDTGMLLVDGSAESLTTESPSPNVGVNYLATGPSTPVARTGDLATRWGRVSHYVFLENVLLNFQSKNILQLFIKKKIYG